jgi:hypothetical protein
MGRLAHKVTNEHSEKQQKSEDCQNQSHADRFIGVGSAYERGIHFTCKDRRGEYQDNETAGSRCGGVEKQLRIVHRG